MKFYKALDSVKLKKYSEVDKNQFALSFYSKSGFKSSELFDKNSRKKFQTFLQMKKDHHFF